MCLSNEMTTRTFGTEGEALRAFNTTLPSDAEVVEAEKKRQDEDEDEDEEEDEEEIPARDRQKNTG